MNFTREPIIETIISPKDGCKLLVRSSRGGETAEEYYVDAIEVVSFGRAFFFRSMERPKAFLVPVSDYEILEVKEPRVALKTSPHERHIKIGGGREVPSRQVQKEIPVEQDLEPAMNADEEESSVAADGDSESTVNGRTDKRRDRRRRRHRRPSDEQEWNARRQPTQESPQSTEGAAKVQGGGAQDETKVSSPILPSLIPPPTTLISQTLSRYKGKEFMEEPSVPKEVNEEKKAEESPGSDVTSLHRNVTEDFSSTSLESERNSYLF